MEHFIFGFIAGSVTILSIVLLLTKRRAPANEWYEGKYW